MKKIGFLLLFVLCGAFIGTYATTTSDIGHANVHNLLTAVKKHLAPAKVDSVSHAADSSYQAMSSEQRESALIQKLSPDQLLELEEVRSGQRSYDDRPLGAAGIVIISLMPFVTAILIVFFIVYYKRKKEARFVDLYEKAIELGRELPADFFRRPQEEKNSHLLTGLIWFGVGIGVTIGGLILMGFNSPWAFGLIPSLVGVAYGISYFVEKKGKANNHKDE
jgi:predicted PurR-regulated permease PerM